MTRLELLASMLDREATDSEIKAAQPIFSENLEFWALCMEAKRLLMEQSNVKDKS